MYYFYTNICTNTVCFECTIDISLHAVILFLYPKWTCLTIKIFPILKKYACGSQVYLYFRIFQIGWLFGKYDLFVYTNYYGCSFMDHILWFLCLFLSYHVQINPWLILYCSCCFRAAILLAMLLTVSLGTRIVLLLDTSTSARDTSRTQTFRKPEQCWWVVNMMLSSLNTFFLLRHVRSRAFSVYANDTDTMNNNMKWI